MNLNGVKPVTRKRIERKKESLLKLRDLQDDDNDDDGTRYQYNLSLADARMLDYFEDVE